MSPLTEPTRLVLAKGQPVPNDPSFAFTSLLLHGNGTNGSTSIIDSSPTPKAITVFGNAQISTAQSRFGGASIAFDGSGDYVTAPVSTDLEFGTGDFTVECFFYINSFAGAKKWALLAGIGRGLNGGIPSDLVTAGWNLLVNASSIALERFDGTTQVSASRSVAVATNTWHHVAACRSGSSLALFLNGSQQGAAFTNTTSYNRIATGGSQDLHIGRWLSGDPAGTAVSGVAYREFSMDGYIEELRITKGIARYTANFTPPTAPFPDF